MTHSLISSNAINYCLAILLACYNLGGRGRDACYSTTVTALVKKTMVTVTVAYSASHVVNACIGPLHDGMPIVVYVPDAAYGPMS